MSWNNSRSCTALLLIAAVLITVSGCARKQWREPLVEKQEEEIRRQVESLLSRRKYCPCCLDAEIAATWDSPLYKGGINGYLQVYLPSSFKLVAINPLGQPLFAFTTDGVQFQSINAGEGVYKHGKVSSFVNRHSLPPHIMHERWGIWLTGRLGFTPEQLVALRQDHTGRGIWLEVEIPESDHFSKEYLLLDLQEKLLLERAVIDSKGNESARVYYRDWDRSRTCPLASALDIQGNEFNTTISIELNNIITGLDYSDDTFYLKLPPGYLRQYYP